MAILIAGPYSRLSGRLRNDVYGVARTRWGKRASARGWTQTIPNPSPEFIAWQEVTKDVDAIATAMTSDRWREAWRFAYRNLPGWHSLRRWLGRCIEYLSPNTQWKEQREYMSLGPVTFPSWIYQFGGYPQNIYIGWDTACSGDYCSPDDVIIPHLVLKTNPADYMRMQFPDGEHKRSDWQWGYNILPPATNFVFFCWFRHTLPNGSYLYSLVKVLDCYTPPL